MDISEPLAFETNDHLREFFEDLMHKVITHREAGGRVHVRSVTYDSDCKSWEGQVSVEFLEPKFPATIG